MNIHDYWYDLPERQIAQVPLINRDSSKLMHLNRITGAISHRIFSDIESLLTNDDVLVLNDTRVLPARLFGTKKDTGARFELLLLHRLDWNLWEVLSRPAKKLKAGTIIEFSTLLSGEIIEEKDEGIRIVKFEFQGIFEEILDQLGHMPLPPYIHHQLDDKERYQTVYSKIKGSSAAPTAGLHFTPELLSRLKNKGVSIEYITLHVGLGTFRPVQVDHIENHVMHSEYYSISEETITRIHKAKEDGKRIVCVGTTTVRTLEAAVENGRILRPNGWTDIFIYPPYSFQMADALITNFHLPESTLLLLVSAFSKKEYILDAYKEAIENDYRFFSFGDAMFIE